MALNEYLNSPETTHIVNIISSQYENFSLEDCVTIVPKLIVFVEKFKLLSGLQKKDLVVEVLKLIIDKTDLPGDDSLLDPVLKQFIPKIIDTLIDVDKRNIKLNKKKCLLTCLTKLNCKMPKKN